MRTSLWYCWKSQRIVCVWRGNEGLQDGEGERDSSCRRLVEKNRGAGAVWCHRGGGGLRVAEKGIKGIVGYKANFTMTAETSGGVPLILLMKMISILGVCLCDCVCVILCMCVCMRVGVCVYLIPDAMPLSIPTSWITGNCPSFCCKAQNQDKTDFSFWWSDFVDRDEEHVQKRCLSTSPTIGFKSQWQRQCI